MKKFLQMLLGIGTVLGTFNVSYAGEFTKLQVHTATQNPLTISCEAREYSDCLDDGKGQTYCYYYAKCICKPPLDDPYCYNLNIGEEWDAYAGFRDSQQESQQNIMCIDRDC